MTFRVATMPNCIEVGRSLPKPDRCLTSGVSSAHRVVGGDAFVYARSGVESRHARTRRNGTGRVSPAVGLLDGAKAASAVPLVAPILAGVATRLRAETFFGGTINTPVSTRPVVLCPVQPDTGRRIYTEENNAPRMALNL